MRMHNVVKLAVVAAAVSAIGGLSAPAASADPIYPLSGCPNLTQGMSSTCVTGLQYELDRYFGFSLAQDGNFGPATEAAVVAFQQKAGIGVDGQAGPQTQAALYNDSQAPATNCQPVLKLEPNFSNGGLNDFGAQMYVQITDPLDFGSTCTGWLERLEKGKWTQISGYHTIPANGGSATSDFYWDGIGAKAKACASAYGSTVCTAAF
ncbi:peptidoglycan-binding domain-containing protein [Streptacidiphilus cavernicola]|uniref:Peptidoglycan-binding protein n=1 Tax=Streptacidiphilus cavernicola TaxID=3342716 RepID=A0ABV6VX79_9ACTN